MTLRFSQIDDSNRGDHYYLTADDKCVYLGERTSGENWSFSETNQLISNLKKRPSTRGTGQWRHKQAAINACAAAFTRGLKDDWLNAATLVPIPPSKHKSDPEYDDRMLQVLLNMPFAGLDVRELIIQRESIRAAHESPDDRPSTQELVDIYQVDEALTDPEPSVIGIVDDVLTAGTHFKAMQQVLGQRFPDVPTVGIFVARSIRRPDFIDIDDWDF